MNALLSAVKEVQSSVASSFVDDIDSEEEVKAVKNDEEHKHPIAPISKVSYKRKCSSETGDMNCSTKFNCKYSAQLHLHQNFKFFSFIAKEKVLSQLLILPEFELARSLDVAILESELL